MPQITYPLPDPLVTTSPDYVGGHTCFAGRRVPVQALFDYLKSGLTLAQFLDDYPNVSREHAVAVIDRAQNGKFRALVLLLLPRC